MRESSAPNSSILPAERVSPDLGFSKNPSAMNFQVQDKDDYRKTLRYGVFPQLCTLGERQISCLAQELVETLETWRTISMIRASFWGWILVRTTDARTALRGPSLWELISAGRGSFLTLC
jgi:hypothetical protein